jgi:drug/metabolite transporter (DMT)-like permease
VGWALQSIYTKRLILGDPLTAPLIVGLAVVAAGIALINHPRPKASAMQNDK